MTSWSCVALEQLTTATMNSWLQQPCFVPKTLFVRSPPQLMALTVSLHYLCYESWALWRGVLFIFNRHCLARPMWCFCKSFGHSKCEIYRVRFVKCFNFVIFSQIKSTMSNMFLFSLFPFLPILCFFFPFHHLVYLLSTSPPVWISYTNSTLMFWHVWRWRILMWLST